MKNYHFVRHAGDGRQVFLRPDNRGETETYEAYSLVCIDSETGRVVWTEGVRKDRANMYSEYRAPVDEILSRIGGGAQ